jgi:hypothetical protein
MRFLFGIQTFVALVLLFASCKKQEPDVPLPEPSFQILDYDLNNLLMSAAYEYDPSVGDTLKVPTLNEASGLAVSRSNPNFFWSHNDSGSPNWLYPVPANGVNHGYVPVSGAGARDWEDICIGPGPLDGVNYIYIADIGDNNLQYNFIIVYRLPEPDLSNFSIGQSVQINSDEVVRFEFEYPDGAVDAETLMIDPWTKDLYLVTKSGYRSILYRAKAPLDSSKRTKLEKLAQLPFNGALAGDISADGHDIVVKTFSKIYCWHRETGQSVLQALSQQPQLLPYILEPQGEAFGWMPDGSGYFTLSEQSGVHPPMIYFYKKN